MHTPTFGIFTQCWYLFGGTFRQVNQGLLPLLHEHMKVPYTKQNHWSVNIETLLYFWLILEPYSFGLPATSPHIFMPSVFALCFFPLLLLFPRVFPGSFETDLLLSFLEANFESSFCLCITLLSVLSHPPPSGFLIIGLLSSDLLLLSALKMRGFSFYFLKAQNINILLHCSNDSLIWFSECSMWCCG